MKTLVRLTAFVCLLAGLSFAQNSVFNVTSSNTAVTATTAGFSAILKENSGSPTATFDVYDPSLSASPVHIGAGGIYVFTRERGYPFLSANILGYVKQTNGAGPTAFVLEQVSSSSITYSVTNSAGGGGTWGSITGTLSDQTDLGTALGLKAPLASPTFSGTPAAPTAASSTNTTQIATTAYVKTNLADYLTTAIAASTYAPLASPTFTGTVSGITKSMVGLGSVDNTADTAKPVSTAQQTALDLKANLASPTFTGTVAGITKSMVGLGSVDNTSDAGKPVSTAQQTALDLKANLASPTIVTPTIASFTNATHNHQSAAGGGALDTAAVTSGTWAAARMPALTGDCTTSSGAVATTCTQLNGSNFTVNTSGVPTKINGLTTVGMGAPILVAKVDLTTQAADISATTLYAVPVAGAGLYRINCYIVETQAATNSSTLPACAQGFTDAETAHGNGLALMGNCKPTGNTIGHSSAECNNAVASMVVNAAASTNITYGTSGYVSSGVTPMQFSVHFKLEYLGN